MQPSCVILYVTNVGHSVEFYSKLLGAAPMEHHPNFAMFKLNESTTIGLWARADAEPKATVQAGSMELGVVVGSTAEVDAAHAQWQAAGWPNLQSPTEMDFGYTATTSDPDGHRVRVFRPT